MRIGILGTGDVGKALANAFVSLGHDVKMGSREPANPKATAWAKEAGPKASAGTFADAAEFGELVVLATLGAAADSVLRAAGPDRLAGKIVIDTTNPLDMSAGLPKLSVGHTDSGGEQVQRLLPGALVVKAFNTVGNLLMFRPDLPGGPPRHVHLRQRRRRQEEGIGAPRRLRLGRHRHRRHRGLPPPRAHVHRLGRPRLPLRLVDPRLQAPEQVTSAEAERPRIV
jgi:8-hydroxy-5-deazaflavin:NADPH oxidoreductase